MKFDDLNLDDIFLESKTEILQEVGEGFGSKATRFLTGIDSTLMQQAEQELAAVKTEAQRLKLISDLDGLIYELNRRKNEGTFWKFFKHWFVGGIVIPFVGGIVGLIWAAIKRGKIKSGETDAIINFLSDVKSRAQRLQLDVQTESMAQPNNGKKRGKAGDSKIILESNELDADAIRNILEDMQVTTRRDGKMLITFSNRENQEAFENVGNINSIVNNLKLALRTSANLLGGVTAYAVALNLGRKQGLPLQAGYKVIQNFNVFLGAGLLGRGRSGSLLKTNPKIGYIIAGCLIITIYNIIKMGSNIYKWWQINKDIKTGNGPINTAVRGNVADLSDEDINRLKQSPAMESTDVYSIEDIDAFLESNESDYSVFLEAKKPRGKKIEGGLSGLGALNKESKEDIKLMKDGSHREYAMLKDLESATRDRKYFKQANAMAKTYIKDFETSNDDPKNADMMAGRVLQALNNVSRYIMNKALPGDKGASDSSIPDKRTASIALKDMQKINTLMKSKYSSYSHTISQNVDFIVKELAELEVKPVEIAEEVSKEVKQEEIITKTETAQLAKAHEEIKEKVIEKEVKEIVDEKPSVKEAIKENDGEIPASVTAEAKKEVEDTQLGSLATKAVSGEKLNAEEKELASNLVSNQQVSSIWTRIKNRAAAYGKNRSTTAGAIRGGIKIAVLYFIAMKLAKSVDGIEIKGYKNVASNLSEMKKIRPWKSVRQFIIAGLLMIMANEAAKMGVGLGRALISKI